MGAALQLNPARRANSQMQHLHGTFATASKPSSLVLGRYKGVYHLSS